MPPAGAPSRPPARRRRVAPALLLATTAVAALVASLGCAATAGPARLNVLVITIEGLRADRLGCYNGGRTATPAIDGLAARGVRFDRAYAASPATVPSVASLLTGVYPRRHGLRHDLGGRLKEEVPTLAEAFRKAGYRTGAIVATAHLDSDRGLARGFDTYDDDIQGVRKSNLALVKERRADEAVRKGVAWLDGNPKGKPFFLWLDFHDPRYDHDPPEALRKQFESDPYQGEVAHVDARIGDLLSTLRERGLEGSTRIVLAGTHGEGLGEHGETGHGYYVYETTVRVPLIMVAPDAGASRAARDPGPGARGQVVLDPVSLLDVAPTLLDLLGSPGRGLDGRSLPLVVKREAAATGEERTLFVEALAPFNDYGWSPMYAVIRGQRKVMVGERLEAFDLAGDPREARALAPPPAWAAELEAHGRALLGETNTGAALRAKVRTMIEDLDPPWHLSPICMEKVTFPDPRDRLDLNDALFRARFDFESKVVGRAARIAEDDVLQKDRSNYAALEIAAFLALRNGWGEYLLHHLEIMQCSYPDRPGAYHLYGHDLEKREDRERAEKALLIYALFDPDNEEPYYDLAILCARDGRKDQAFDYLAKSIRYGAEDLGFIRRDARLSSLRDDPRFASLVGPAAPSGAPR